MDFVGKSDCKLGNYLYWRFRERLGRDKIRFKFYEFVDECFDSWWIEWIYFEWDEGYSFGIC